jgi:hypothetical protein
MLAQCANPNCGTQLRSFLEGRLFQFEVVSISISAADRTDGPFDEKPTSQTAQFWLCSECAGSMRLELQPINGLRLVPLEVEAPDIPGTANAGITSQIHNC